MKNTVLMKAAAVGKTVIVVNDARFHIDGEEITPITDLKLPTLESIGVSRSMHEYPLAVDMDWPDGPLLLESPPCESFAYVVTDPPFGRLPPYDGGWPSPVTFRGRFRPRGPFKIPGLGRRKRRRARIALIRAQRVGRR